MGRMTTSILIAAAALVTGMPGSLAQPQSDVHVSRQPGKATITGTHKITATVVGIDAGTRTVTLKGPKGKTVDLQAGEEMRNFDQLKVGDVVHAVYKEALTLTLKKKNGEPSTSEREGAMRSKPGEKPGGAVGREVTVTADVIAVNTETKMVTLKGPEGKTVDLKVEDPENLKAVKKGDQVEAVYTEALAVSVQPEAKAAKK
jgi:hypothetical protein